jgi:hypothetical protein
LLRNSAGAPALFHNLRAKQTFEKLRNHSLARPLLLKWTLAAFFCCATYLLRRCAKFNGCAAKAAQRGI